MEKSENKEKLVGSMFHVSKGVIHAYVEKDGKKYYKQIPNSSNTIPTKKEVQELINGK